MHTEKTAVMDEQERAYILENARRVELWEETPKAPSGRCSDMTEVEKEKLIDMLYSMVDSRDRQIERLGDEIRRLRIQSENHHRNLQSRFDRMEERAVKAEREMAGERAAREQAEKRAEELQKTVDALMDGSLVKELERQILEAELERDAAKSSDRQNRTEMYGRKSQRLKASKKSPDNPSGKDRDAEEEKNDMGGRDSVGKLPDKKEGGNGNDNGGQDQWTANTYNGPRDYRKGMRHNKMSFSDIVYHDSDENEMPDGWSVIKHFKRYVAQKITKILGHCIDFIICRDENGGIRVLYQPKGHPERRWCRRAESIADAIRMIKNGPVLDDNNDPIVDCVPGTSANAEMIAETATDHYVNNIPCYRLRNYYEDCGLSLSRQTLSNWLEKGALLAQPLVNALMDIAIEKDSIINCDETWCKVRVNGEYRKRYTWCLVNKEKKIVIYCYRKGARSRKAFRDIIGDRLPMAIQTDGYNVYMYIDDELIDCEHLCCMAHARAKFFKAWDINREPDAKFIIDLINELYKLESHYSALGLTPAEIRKRRNNDETSEIVIRLRSKIDAMKAEGHPPRSELLDKAVSYLDSFWKQIMAYRNNGRYSIDNNVAERFIKPLANERKNSLFFGSDKMAHVSTVYHTLISTCRQLKISATRYLGKLFAKLVRGCTDYTSLLPMNIGLSVNNY